MLTEKQIKSRLLSFLSNLKKGDSATIAAKKSFKTQAMIGPLKEYKIIKKNDQGIYIGCQTKSSVDSFVKSMIEIGANKMMEASKNKTKDASKSKKEPKPDSGQVVLAEETQAQNILNEILYEVNRLKIGMFDIQQDIRILSDKIGG